MSEMDKKPHNSPPTSSSSISGSILLVEDDTALAELVQDYLEVEGFSVEYCPDGTKGLQRALEGAHDLVLLDLMLPGTGGFEILKSYRKLRNQPVLVISARGGDLDKIRGLGLGADDYVSKPFSPAELVARVKAHLKRYHRLIGSASATGPQQQLIQVGQLVLDIERRHIRRNGTILALTAKELELLSLFLQHPGRLFSKEELYQRIWGSDTQGDISTVTVHIRRIREKIEQDPADPHVLETVWGLGYRLSE